jgi:hypothetical protein
LKIHRLLQIGLQSISIGLANLGVNGWKPLLQLVLTPNLLKRVTLDGYSENVEANLVVKRVVEHLMELFLR